MSHIAGVKLPSLPMPQIVVTAPDAISISGTIATKDPSRDVGECLQAFHRAALADGLKELKVDVTGLTFVNSSAIRLFVDWATWVKSTAEPRYRLRFVTSRKATWQKTSFPALLSLARDVLTIDQVD
jgi:hypothetical protein